MNIDQSKIVVLYIDSSDKIAYKSIIPSKQGLFSELCVKMGVEKLVSLDVQNSELSDESGVTGISENIENTQNIDYGISTGNSTDA